jgi:hypothetical protein
MDYDLGMGGCRCREHRRSELEMESPIYSRAARHVYSNIIFIFGSAVAYVQPTGYQFLYELICVICSLAPELDMAQSSMTWVYIVRSI